MKNKEEMIKKIKKERKQKKIRLGIISICLILVGILLVEIYVSLGSATYIKSKETANIDYKVYLKENEFYETPYVGEGTNVIASLVKNIETEFKYNLNLSEETEYTYSYNIVGKLEVLEGEGEDTVFEKDETLLTKETQKSNSKNLSIDETLDIDYGEYNQKINNFIRTYSLSGTTNRLVLMMNLYVNNIYDGTRINKDTKVMTMEIPLTTQTVDIALTKNVTQNDAQVLVNKKDYKYSKYYLIAGIILLIVGIAEFARFIKYTLDIRSAETMYEQTLKSIIVGYKSYIQKTNNEVKEKGYEILELNSFLDLVNMRDVVNSPILMYEEDKYRTKFMMVNDKRLFVYILDANLIRENLREKNKEKEEKKQNSKNKNKDKKTEKDEK